MKTIMYQVKQDKMTFSIGISENYSTEVVQFGSIVSTKFQLTKEASSYCAQ
jgi:hypothetical protein